MPQIMPPISCERAVLGLKMRPPSNTPSIAAGARVLGLEEAAAVKPPQLPPPPALAGGGIDADFDEIGAVAVLREFLELLARPRLGLGLQIARALARLELPFQLEARF